MSSHRLVRNDHLVLIAVISTEQVYGNDYKCYKKIFSYLLEELEFAPIVGSAITYGWYIPEWASSTFPCNCG